MDKLLLDKMLEAYDVEVKYIKGFGAAGTIYLNNKYYVCIDADIDQNKAYYMLWHELEHIKEKTLYKADIDEYHRLQLERQTNDQMILDLQLVTKYKAGIELPTELVEYIKQYLLREELTKMENMVNLLCLKNNISIHELAMLIGTSDEKARLICEEKTIIEYETLVRLSEVFDKSIDYILCKGVDN